jgi:hypothetical protein
VSFGIAAGEDFRIISQLMTPISLILLSNMTPRYFVRSISPPASIFQAFSVARNSSKAKRFAQLSETAKSSSMHYRKAVVEHFTLDLHRTVLFSTLVASFSRFNEKFRLHFMLRLSIFIKVGWRSKPNYSGAARAACKARYCTHRTHCSTKHLNRLTT